MDLESQGDTGAVASDSWQALAEKHWAKPSSKRRKVRVDVIEKELWSRLEQEQFDYTSLLSLESGQLLERHAERPNLTACTVADCTQLSLARL